MIRKYRNLLSLAMMIVLTCVTQVFTLLKSSMVAGNFGTSMEMDAYNFANSIVSFIFGFVAAAISTVVIPSYVHKQHGKEVDSFITGVYGTIALIITLVIIFRFQLVGVFSNKGEMYLNIACNILLILMMTNFLYSLTNVTAAYFQCIEKYNIPKILNLVTQMFVVGALIVFHDINIIQYTYILSAGFLINFVIDIIAAIKYGWRYKPSFLFKSEETKRLFKMFIPIILSTGIYKLSLVIDSTIASRLETGQLSILSYSSQIVNMVNSILIGNLLIYSYPKIVRRIKTGESQKLFWEQVSFFHLVVCLVIAGIATVGHEGISLLFEHGHFNSAATDAVFACLLIYISGQQFNVIRDLVYRYFYALGNTKVAASNSVLVSVVNIVVSIILVNFLGLYGIIIGTVFATVVSFARILMKFKKIIGFEVSTRKLMFSLASNILIALASVAIVYLTKMLLPIDSVLLSLILFGVETLAVFLGLTFLLKRNILTIIKNL